MLGFICSWSNIRSLVLCRAAKLSSNTACKIIQPFPLTLTYSNCWLPIAKLQRHLTSSCKMHFLSTGLSHGNSYSECENIRNLNGCEWIENSVMRVTVRHHGTCRVMQNSYPEWKNFQFAPNNRYRFFFLHTFDDCIEAWICVILSTFKLKEV